MPSQSTLGWIRQSEAHGVYADEQLANLQKRIFLIEFLHLGLVIVYQGAPHPHINAKNLQSNKTPAFAGIFLLF